jgi:hypothetical protein
MLREDQAEASCQSREGWKTEKPSRIDLSGIRPKEEAPARRCGVNRGFRAVPCLLVNTGVAWLANLNVGGMFQKEEAQWGNSTGLRGSDAHDERGRGRWDADARSWKKANLLTFVSLAGVRALQFEVLMRVEALLLHQVKNRSAKSQSSTCRMRTLPWHPGRDLMLARVLIAPCFW